MHDSILQNDNKNRKDPDYVSNYNKQYYNLNKDKIKSKRDEKKQLLKNIKLYEQQKKKILHGYELYKRRSIKRSLIAQLKREKNKISDRELMIRNTSFVIIFN